MFSRRNMYPPALESSIAMVLSPKEPLPMKNLAVTPLGEVLSRQGIVTKLARAVVVKRVASVEAAEYEELRAENTTICVFGPIPVSCPALTPQRRRHRLALIGCVYFCA